MALEREDRTTMYLQWYEVLYTHTQLCAELIAGVDIKEFV